MHNKSCAAINRSCQRRKILERKHSKTFQVKIEKSNELVAKNVLPSVAEQVDCSTLGIWLYLAVDCASSLQKPIQVYSNGRPLVIAPTFVCGIRVRSRVVMATAAVLHHHPWPIMHHRDPVRRTPALPGWVRPFEGSATPGHFDRRVAAQSDEIRLPV